MEVNIKKLWEDNPYLGIRPGHSWDVWSAQLDLMRVYQEKGRLMDHGSFDINNRDHQKFMRELMGFLEEEIIEAQSSYELMVNEAHTPTLNGLSKGAERADFNEEVADCLHFWVEIFIFLGFEHEDLVNYYHRMAHEKGMNSVSDNYLKMAMQYANSYKSRNYPSKQIGFIIDPPNEWLPWEVNGSLVGQDSLDYLNRHTFYAIKHLKVAQNFMKNKYWKAREDYQVDTTGMLQEVMEAWLHWTISLTFTDYSDSHGMIYTYLLKNKKNVLKSSTH